MIRPISQSVEDVDVVLIGEALVAEVEQWVLACECCVENATLSLDYLLDALTACDPQATVYVMCRPAKCPSCRGEIREKTHVAL